MPAIQGTEGRRPGAKPTGRKPGTGLRIGGRKAGTPNKCTAEIKALAQVHGPAVIARLAEIAFDAQPDDLLAAANIRKMIEEGATDEEVARYGHSGFALRTGQATLGALKELLDRGYGRPAQPVVGGDGEDGGPVKLVVSWME